MTTIEARGLIWTPEADDTSLGALRGLDLHAGSGELIVLTGDIAAARTFLRVCAGLLRPHAGALLVEGTDLGQAKSTALAAHRRRLGALLGDAETALIGGLDPLENVLLPLRLAGVPREEQARRAAMTLGRLGVEAANREGTAWSAAEGRLAAIAAALVTEPPLVLLEEPTRGLDAQAAGDVLQTLLERAERGGATVIVATHDVAAVNRAPRIVTIRNGRVTAERTRRMAFSRGEGERVEDFAPVDADGRVTIPGDDLRALGIEDRAAIVRTGDHLEVRPERPPGAGQERRWGRRPT